MVDELQYVLVGVVLKLNDCAFRSSLIAFKFIMLIVEVDLNRALIFAIDFAID